MIPTVSFEIVDESNYKMIKSMQRRNQSSSRPRPQQNPKQEDSKDNKK